MTHPTSVIQVLHDGQVFKPRFNIGDWIGYNTAYAGKVCDHHGLVAGIGWCQSTPHSPDTFSRWDGFMHKPGFVYLVHPLQEAVALFTVFDCQIFSVFSEELAARYNEQRQRFLKHLQTDPFAK